MNVALKDLKKKKKINEVTNNAAVIKLPISFIINCELRVRM